MSNIRDISIQKLFLVVILLKVGSSLLGWVRGDPWILGFGVPLLFMVGYIIVGLNRRTKEVSDEKFADSCYYLGFIFTITSIVISLLDIPSIGTNMESIAVRFGAAMVSTVLGLGVRVYLVSFRADVADSITNAEDALFEASRRFADQLSRAQEKLEAFQEKVESASQAAVERVNIQIESITKNNADALQAFFEGLKENNAQALQESIDVVKKANKRLSDSFDHYAQGMRANLTSIEKKVVEFSDEISKKLLSSAFPEDYFSTHLEGPLQQLKAGADSVLDSVKQASGQVTDSTQVLANALKKIRTKSTSAEGALDKVIALTTQQEQLLGVSTGQLAALENVVATLSGLDESIKGAVAEIKAGANQNAQIITQTAAVISDNQGRQVSLEASVASIVGSLEKNAALVDKMAGKLTDNIAATMALARRIEASVGHELRHAGSNALRRTDTSGPEAGERLGGEVHQVREDRAAEQRLNSGAQIPVRASGPMPIGDGTATAIPTNSSDPAFVRVISGGYGSTPKPVSPSQPIDPTPAIVETGASPQTRVTSDGMVGSASNPVRTVLTDPSEPLA